MNYLKRITAAPFPKKIQAMVKICNGKALHCYNNSIEIDGLDGDDNDSYHIAFYYNLEYVEATKEEFDEFYIEAVKNINLICNQ